MAKRMTDNPELNEALNLLARFLAVRDHSRLELQDKLTKKFSENVTAEALRIATEKRWLAPEEEIAARAALVFQRKLKSRLYIESQLVKRGLPLPEFDHSAECMTARKVVEKRFGNIEDLSFAERQQALRYLSYRGFDENTIRTVLNAE